MILTDEEAEFEYSQIKALMGGGNRNAGMLVTTKGGFVGRTYSSEDFINGKVRVYTEKGKFLCDPSTLTVNGFID